MSKEYLPFGSPDFTEREIEAVARVMRSGWVGMGAETQAFENELASYTGAAHVVAVNSCTSALFLSLLAEGVKPGDEVIIPSLTWCSDANVVLQAGAVPVFCDVDAENLCVTPETVLKQVTTKTRAVIIVHYGGYAIDVKRLRALLPPEISIIEDAAHALGAFYPDGTRVGSSGNPVCFSFYANKNISTADGGAIAIKDPDKAERLRVLRMNGLPSNAWARFTNPAVMFSGDIRELGYKMNYTDLQAAIGRVQLARLEEMGSKRLEIARAYKVKCAEILPDLKFQQGLFEANHARHLFVGFFSSQRTGMSRNDFLLALRERKIGASIHYAPLHLMSFYKPYLRGGLSVTERVAGDIMTLPISAKMTLEDVAFVTAHIGDLVRSKRNSA